jgi:predicted nuclease of predicted toxin-antitoxin system
MLSLMLDEPITPSMCPALHALNIDVYHIRDRSLLGAMDHELWKRAKDEIRTVVTSNGEDFRDLCARDETHPGVLVIPGGKTRAEQTASVMRAVKWAAGRNAILSSFRDQFVTVGNDNSIEAEVVVSTSAVRALSFFKTH